MGKMNCFSGLGLLGGKRKASKGNAKKASGNDCPKVKPVESMDMADTVVDDDVSRRGDSSVPASACYSRFVVHAAAELARHASDQNGDKAAVKRDSSAADLVAGVGSSGYSSDVTGNDAKSAEPDDGEPSSLGRMSPTASPKLMRSCSNIETTRSVPAGSDLPAKSRSYNDLKTLPPGRSTAARSGAVDASPTASFRTSYSADRVMLKKRSSRQPPQPAPAGRERDHAHAATIAGERRRRRRRRSGAAHQHDGYTSDTLGAVTADAKNKGVAMEADPIPSQWVAFSAEASPLDRVSAWVNSLGDGSFHAVDEDDATGHGGASRPRRPRCSEIVELSTTAGGKRHPPQAKRRAADEVAQASGIVPTIAAFSTLRAVNLSGNLIVQISAGSLPKGLHSLDLSRNKIAIIEGLRELTRLRVLNLSYNRISRIGHGLSSCTAIRELYLAGNKISDVEGLHRLLKLAVLDVSFNKITTAKSLGQLVANYGSLRAINLLGNPVQANTGDDTLRKAVSGLLPRIEYLNKQAVKPQRALEVAKDSVAQAALGNAGWNSRRRLTRRLSQSPGSTGKGRGRDGNGNGSRRGSRSRSMTRPQSSSLPRR
ncbi:unnamed protein product [Miscanthus lutarioriparius]|uniref:Outer arm dynein light chain 1 protein n=1 Tax=Miscanthus lutarioriparius TaxID=422564 RepID=A0A811MSX9_9POAL|nr:unnamed protein product [Miscanthus lutarioriparius]